MLNIACARLCSRKSALLVEMLCKIEVQHGIHTVNLGDQTLTPSDTWARRPEVCSETPAG